MSYIEIQHLSKQYPRKAEWALKHFQLSIEKGEFVAIVGPSGSGKSTLLNLLTGFEQVTEGRFIIAEREVTHEPPKERNISLVFQEYALFPHMTVRENISFGMKVRKEGKREIAAKVSWAAEQLAIEELLEEKPKHLSGGQRQRVALARAIVREPKLFLMDEPLSNLDAKLREQTGALIRQVHDQLKATTIFVTHAQDEAMSLADRIVVLRDGRIQQIGTPREIYEQPANLFTAQFIGRPEINCFEGRLSDTGTLQIGTETMGQGFTFTKAQSVVVGIRSEDIRLVSASTEKGCTGKVTGTRYLGSDLLIELEWQGQKIVVREQAGCQVTVGQELQFLMDEKKMLFFSKDDEKRIDWDVSEN